VTLASRRLGSIKHKHDSENGGVTRYNTYRMKITAAIITKNEEQKLADCIQDVRSVADEVVVVDSGSNDRTLEIARQSADIARVQPFENFSRQRNFAASHASNSWILSIDADERLSNELKERILKLKQEENPRYQAYCFPRKTYGRDGQMLFNIVSYPGFHYRLYHRDFCRWRNPVHETLEVDGRRKFCPEHLLHYPNYDLVPEKETLYNRLKLERDREKRSYTIFETISNFWFHFRALFIDLGFYRKGWVYWKHGAQILIHLAGLRLTNRPGAKDATKV
jgi:glycosyltransferase involved in cell wall biosynthesis